MQRTAARLVGWSIRRARRELVIAMRTTSVPLFDASFAARLTAARIALRVAELSVLAATTAVVWGRSQSAPHGQIMAEARVTTRVWLKTNSLKTIR